MPRLLIEIFIISLAIAGVIALGLYTGQKLIAHNGDPAATVLLSENALSSTFLLFAQAIGCLIAGSAIGRLLNSPGAGFLVMSVGMLAFVSQTGTIQDWMRQRTSDSAVWPIIESCIYSIIAFSMAWALAKSICYRQHAPHDATDHHTNAFKKFVAMLSRMFVGIIVALPVIWLIARSELAGQTIAATTIAAAVATMVMYLFASTKSNDATAYTLLYAVTPLAGAIGYAIFYLYHAPPTHPFPASPMSGLTPLMLPTPLHYFAGTLLGTNIGLVWAKSFEPNDVEVLIAAS